MSKAQDALLQHCPAPLISNTEVKKRCLRTAILKCGAGISVETRTMGLYPASLRDGASHLCFPKPPCPQVILMQVSLRTTGLGQSEHVDELPSLPWEAHKSSASDIKLASGPLAHRILLLSELCIARWPLFLKRQERVTRLFWTSPVMSRNQSM
jgi:hypothetical protein